MSAATEFAIRQRLALLMSGAAGKHWLTLSSAAQREWLALADIAVRITEGATAEEAIALTTEVHNARRWER